MLACLLGLLRLLMLTNQTQVVSVVLVLQMLCAVKPRFRPSLTLLC